MKTASPAGGGRIGDLADLCGLLRFAIINRKTGDVGILLSIQPCIAHTKKDPRRNCSGSGFFFASPFAEDESNSNWACWLEIRFGAEGFLRENGSVSEEAERRELGSCSEPVVCSGSLRCVPPQPVRSRRNNIRKDRKAASPLACMPCHPFIR